MEVAYSESFDFFVEHQIALATTNGGRHNTFFSRLDGKLFKKIDGYRELSDDEITEICFSVHQEIIKL